MTRQEIESLFNPAFEIIRPPRAIWPVIFNSPHSGRHYPPAFIARSRLNARILRSSEDAFVDELFKPVAKARAPLMHAFFPRAYVDLNRDMRELDPELFNPPLPADTLIDSQSVACGLGIIPRVVSEMVEIYDSRLDPAEAEARIEALYIPYHASLAALVEEMQTSFGNIVLVDCHSMPSSANTAGKGRRADFVLGDLKGISCAPQIIDAAQNILSSQGFSVMRNIPYAGGYNTRKYALPGQGVHAIQIEINRALYMNEYFLKKNRRFDNLINILEKLAYALAQTVNSLQDEGRIAAE